MNFSYDCSGKVPLRRRIMNSLSGLLVQISSIPPDELQPRKTEFERPTEMAIIREVLSKDQVNEAKERHPNKAKIRHACNVRRGVVEMEFHIPHKGFHRVIASYGSDGLMVTDNDQTVTIGDSVEEFRGYLLGLIEEKDKAGAL
jgi:hypothetical protein